MDLSVLGFLLAPEVLGSAALVAATHLLRSGLTRLIREHGGDRGASGEVLSDRQWRWISRARTFTWLAAVLGLAAIWAPALHAFALSLTAVAVAVVIATKELILCLSGAVLRASTQAYAVGDWIEVGAVKGEVTDHGLLATTLQEIDVDSNTYEYTGRTLVVPNSALLTAAVRNENFMKRYVFHRFQIHLEPDAVGDLAELEALILDRLERESAPFRDVARRYNGAIRRRTGVGIMGPESRVLVSTTDLAKVCLTVMLFCPTKSATPIQQAVTRDVLRAVRAGRVSGAADRRQPFVAA